MSWRRPFFPWAVSAFAAWAVLACTTLPKPKQSWYTFPKDAHVEDVSRASDRLGVVRSKVNFRTLDADYDEDKLCKNYYNKAVAELVRHAKAKGADAVIEVRSVVFLENGKSEIHKTPECSDDGEEGQILAMGVAVRWKKDDGPSPSPTPSVLK
jgi:hypothetical protein